MSNIVRRRDAAYRVLPALACAFPALAADAAAPAVYPWMWWPAMPWPAFGWFLPFVCFVAMAVLCWLVMRRGGCACTWCGGATGRSGRSDALRRSGAGRPSSALEILDERYARGEIDGNEYAQKKAAIASPPSPTEPGA